MQPLGLGRADRTAYYQHLRSSHDYRIGVDVLRLDGRVMTSIDPTLIDGQVNISSSESVYRTATFTFHDPDRNLHLDAFSPWEGALFADRMIRVRHETTPPTVGPVEVVPFVGPVVKLSRDGDTVAVECQDKSSLAMTGSRPFTVQKGRNAVNAIRAILRECTGERNFRFPKGIRRRLPRAYSVGWAAESSPWLVCQKIARLMNMNLFYSGDGYATLRRWSNTAVITITEQHLTSRLKADFDITDTRNRVIINGTVKRRVRVKPKKGKAKFVTRTTKISVFAQVGSGHPLAPGKLGRNGSPRWLPLLEVDQTFRQTAGAHNRARTLLRQNSSMSAEVTFSTIPIYHLDVFDMVRVETDRGFVNVRYISSSIPLGVEGDMSVGQTRKVARGRRA